MITAIAIDDEPVALLVVANFCSKVEGLSLKRTFTETNAALAYLKDNPVDLLFLDINMPALSGIDFYKKVDNYSMVIFTTSHTEYAVEGFNLSAIDYLLKPFDFKRFLKAVEKATEYHAYLSTRGNDAPQYLFVKADYSILKVPVSDILYIEGLDNYLKIHLSDSKTLLVRMSMKGIAEKLSAEEFIRVHRSFIIPFSKVTAVRNKIIYMDKTEIPIGTNYVDDVLKLFKEK